MNRVPLALMALLVVAGCGEGSRTDVSYAVVKSSTHDCAKDSNVSIETSELGFKLTSTCDRILIKGGKNRITIEAAKMIDVDGAQNTLEVSAVDVIRVNGVGNTVKFKKKGVTKKTQDIVAIGDNNTLIQEAD
jgi:uncharacterized protein (DUF2345 family)